MPGDSTTRAYYAQLTRFAAVLAFVSDVVLAVLGGALKRRERLSARLADVLSLLYLGSCVLKRYDDQGRQPGDVPLVRWAMDDTLCRIGQALRAVFENLRPAWVGHLLSGMVFPLRAREFHAPSDDTEAEVARAILQPGAVRERLTHGVFVSRSATDAVATLEAALQAVIVSEPLEARLRSAAPAGAAYRPDDERPVRAAVEAGLITLEEAEAVMRAARLRREAIMVDDFPRDLSPMHACRTTQAVSFEQLEPEDRTIR
ncbi:MAG TPA: DUF1974 domain-containing protein, partial [Burkholderiales bacterium]|nr:DUF1974 domain-containing protein [Burkholderiales bacterium]